MKNVVFVKVILSTWVLLSACGASMQLSDLANPLSGSGESSREKASREYSSSQASGTKDGNFDPSQDQAVDCTEVTATLKQAVIDIEAELGTEISSQRRIDLEQRRGELYKEVDALGVTCYGEPKADPCLDLAVSEQTIRELENEIGKLKQEILGSTDPQLKAKLQEYQKVLEKSLGFERSRKEGLVCQA
jgi:hypothetical protein